MSGLLAGKVWHSALSPVLKPVAAALADSADDDGTNCYPSTDMIAWKVGLSRRATQLQIDQLRDLGVLVPQCHENCRGLAHGRGRPIWYTLDATALPARPPWEEERERLRAEKAEAERLRRQRKGAVPTPIPDADMGEEHSPISGPEWVQNDAERVQSAAEWANPVAPDPSEIDPYDPSVEREISRAAVVDEPAQPRAPIPLFGRPEFPPEDMPRGGPELTDPQRSVLAYLHEQMHRVIWGGTNAPDPHWCEDLVRRGASRSDVDHAIQRGVEVRQKQRRAPHSNYIRTCLEERVKTREAGGDPDGDVQRTARFGSQAGGRANHAGNGRSRGVAGNGAGHGFTYGLPAGAVGPDDE